jgi:hypothetical protein
MTRRHAEKPLAIEAATASTSRQRWTDALIAASPSVLLLRDGELLLYRRTRSLLYQCRLCICCVLDSIWLAFSLRKMSTLSEGVASGSP